MEARPRSTRSPRRVILLLFLLSGATFLFTERGGGVSLAARRGGYGSSGSGGACAARTRAAIVIVSYVPVGAAGEARLAVFVRSVASIARFWPAHEVEVFVADNNAADAGSGALLRAAVRRALGAATDEEADAALRLRIVPNSDAAGGWRYVWGGVRSVVRAEGWRACVPFEYVVVLHHTMALLRPLAFPIDGGGAATEPFCTFLHSTRFISTRHTARSASGFLRPRRRRALMAQSIYCAMASLGPPGPCRAPAWDAGCSKTCLSGESRPKASAWAASASPASSPRRSAAAATATASTVTSSSTRVFTAQTSLRAPRRSAIGRC